MDNYVQTWSMDGVNLFCSLKSVETFSIIIDIIYHYHSQSKRP